jgi:hypothetical protein
MHIFYGVYYVECIIVWSCGSAIILKTTYFAGFIQNQAPEITQTVYHLFVGIKSDKANEIVYHLLVGIKIDYHFLVVSYHPLLNVAWVIL